MPPTASRVSLVRASTTTLEVCWSATPTAQAYILEVQKIEQPPQPQPTAVAALPGNLSSQSDIYLNPTTGECLAFVLNAIVLFPSFL